MLSDQIFLSFKQSLHLYDEFVQHYFCCNNLKSQISVKLKALTEAHYEYHVPLLVCLHLNFCFHTQPEATV